MKKSKKLIGDKQADIVIIGGGLAGIWSAYLLSEAGKKVILIEAKKLLSGATPKTTAFITQVIDTDLTDLVKMFGPKKTKLIWHSHGKAIDLIESVIKKEKIECAFKRCNSYSYAQSAHEYQELEKEQRIAKKLGLKTFLVKKTLGFPNAGSWLVKNQAKYDSLAFAKGLIKKAKQNGAEFYENTEALSIESKNSPVVKTKYASIRAKYSITTTYQPFNNPKEVFLKKGMYKSYVFKVQVPKGLFEEAIYEDLENPYHYFRIDPQGKFDQMIVGGEDHRIELKIDEKKNFVALEEYLSTLLGKHKYKILEKWTGPILEPTDGLALIGKVKPNQLLASAFSGNGMTYSAISAMIFRDIILKRPNSWINVYDPKRKPSIKQLAKKGRDYTQEFFNGAVKNVFKREKVRTK